MLVKLKLPGAPGVQFRSNQEQQLSTGTFLNVIEIQQPCPADWGQMRGDDRSRYCEHCRKHVYNFSAMSSDEAQQLICQSAGDLCARFARSESGQVLTLDYQAIPKRSRVRWLLVCLGALLTSAASVAAFVLDRPVAPIKTAALRLEAIRPPAAPPTTQPFLLGKIACPIVPPATQPSTRPSK